MPRLLVVHPEYGVYIGSAMGAAFWSRVDSIGQDSAYTFASHESAQCFIDYCAGQVPGFVAGTLAVMPDSKDGLYASIQACVHAGTEGWVDKDTPVANCRPC
jgi:hypothetical protein